MDSIGLRTPEQLRELIHLATRRKFELDKQAVILGITVDPKVLLEREDLDKEIGVYASQLRRLKRRRLKRRRPKLRPLKRRRLTKEPDEMTAASIDIRPADLRQAVADAREQAQQATHQAQQAQQAAQRAQATADAAQDDVKAVLVEVRPLAPLLQRVIERSTWTIVFSAGGFVLALAALIIALLK